jgi:Flp pilus assembly pilin Flp
MRIRRLRRDERGAAVVEFALVLPILMLVLFAIVDFARAYYTINTLAAAVREGARFASARDLDLSCIPNACSGDVDAIRARSDTLIKRALVALPADDRYFITFDGQSVTVMIHAYPYRALTPIAAALGAGTWYMDRTAVFRWERAP